MAIPNPDVLDRKMNKAKTIVEFNLCKISALKSLCDLMGFYEMKANPYLSGKIPYNTELIAILFDRIHRPLPIDSFYATQLMLDYYCPMWKDYASNHVKGLIIDRNSTEVRDWRKQVLKRDQFKCVNCGSNENIHAHHIVHWADSPSLRANIDNGITLCSLCHREEHLELSDKLFKQHDR